jgi:hypothetical protein
MERRVGGLEEKDLPSSEVTARWEGLTQELRDRVGLFPTLPQSEPGATDAAYCLFLHSLAVRTMRFSEAWPKAVAKRLGMHETAG